MDYDFVLVRYGEISLKSEYVRNKFELILVDNIRNAFKLNNLDCKITRERGRIYIETVKFNKEFEILKKIFGIVSFNPVIKTTSEIDDISDIAVKFSKKMITKENSFALRVSRTGNHNFTSQQVAIRIGNDIVKATKARVNLTAPDFELFIEVRDKKSFIYNKKIRGSGGLPLGSQGHILSLINDYQSILAAWYLMRRGCDVSFILKNKILLNDLQSFSKDWFIDLKIFFIKSEKDDFYEKLNSIAKNGNYSALVTGHSIYHGKRSIVSDIRELKKNIKISVLHPLIAMNKDEINRKCKEIGISL